MSTKHDPWPEGVGKLILESCDSTMDEARARVDGLVRPTWILAKEQRRARGRRGRVWKAPAGHFSATLVYRPGCAPGEAALRSFCAANALYEALALYIDRDALGLKWPNDVLLNGGKVAGILLECAGTGPFVDWLAVGVGVNLREAPPDERSMAFRPVALVEQGGEAVSREEFLAALASAYATQEGVLAAFGFGRIREDWLRRAARLGGVITAQTGREEITGVFETIDEGGNLILAQGGNTRRVIPAADVYF